MAQGFGGWGVIGGMKVLREMAAIVAGGVLLAVCGCERSEEVTVVAKGSSLVGLVETEEAPVFDPDAGVFMEIVQDGDEWRVYHLGEEMNGTYGTKEVLFDILKKGKERCDREGYEPRLLISAKGETEFEMVREAVQVAARTGIVTIAFLVEVPGGDEVCALRFDLPVMSSHSMPAIEPMYLWAKGDGTMGSGMGEAAMQAGRHGVGVLDEMEMRLMKYSYSAKAANTVTIVELYVAGNAPYQCFVDLLGCCHRQGIDHVMGTVMERTGMGLEPPSNVVKAGQPVRIVVPMDLRGVNEVQESSGARGAPMPSVSPEVPPVTWDEAWDEAWDGLD